MNNERATMDDNPIMATWNYTANQQVLVELYQLQRLADLNVRYYGSRADSTGRWQTTLQIISAVGSSATILGLLAGFPHLLIVISGAATLAAVVLPLLSLNDKVERFEKLHFAYGQLRAACEALARKIRTLGDVVSENSAELAVLSEIYDRLSPLDEPKPNPKLINRLTDEVQAAIPIESLWLPTS